MPNALEETIGRHLDRCQVSRRSFLEFCGKLMIAAPAGLSLTSLLSPEAVAKEVEEAARLHVIWLHFQDCTGCSETLLRTSTPDLSELILHLISLDYHETLMAASGYQAEEALRASMTANQGKYICVVEGSIPRKHQGAYMKLAGRPAIEVLREVADTAAAVVAIGSCASWGGIPSTAPNPTGATGAKSILDEYGIDTPVVNLPGCPPNPYTFLATVLQVASGGGLPALDEKGRPKFAYGRLIHEHCPRRAHYDAGRFAQEFGDYGHRNGYCLYKLGCKGPVTHAACSTRHFNEIPGCWPIGIGAPCVGCTEEAIAFKVPTFELAAVQDAKPPAFYPSVEEEAGDIDPLATALAGLGLGVLAGGTFVASQRFSRSPGDPGLPGGTEVETRPERSWRGPEPADGEPKDEAPQDEEPKP
jgi:hydrogenase small subunit